MYVKSTQEVFRKSPNLKQLSLTFVCNFDLNKYDRICKFSKLNRKIIARHGKKPRGKTDTVIWGALEILMQSSLFVSWYVIWQTSTFGCIETSYLTFLYSNDTINMELLLS